jgi:predicted MFS family arabinose efflux permease
MQTPPTRTLWTRDFVLLMGSSLLTWISFYFLLPTLPLYIAHSLDGSPSQVGLISSRLTLSAIFARPVAGYALDRWGRRWVHLVFLAMFCVVTLSYNLAHSLLLLALIRFAHGIPFGGSTTAAATVAADLVPASRRGEGISYFGLATTFAVALGPALALSVLGDGQYGRLFATASLISVCGLVMAWQVRFPDIRNRGASFSPTALVETRVGWLAVTTLLAWLGYGAIVTFITLHASEVGVAHPGWFYSTYALGLVLSRALSGRVFDRYGPRWPVSAGLALVCVSYAVLGLWRTELGYVSAALALGLGFGNLTPAVLAMAVNLVPPERRGAANATVYAAIDVGIGLGSNTLGAVAQAAGSYAPMYLVAAVLLVLPAVLFFARVLPDYAQHSKPPASM